jgi:hypothetical protein
MWKQVSCMPVMFDVMWDSLSWASWNAAMVRRTDAVEAEVGLAGVAGVSVSNE